MAQKDPTLSSQDLREMIDKHRSEPSVSMSYLTFAAMAGEILRLREASYDALLDDAHSLLAFNWLSANDQNGTRQRVYERWLTRERFRFRARHGNVQP